MNKTIAILAIFFLSFAGKHLQAQDKIQWLTWEQMMKKYDKEKKKILVDVYTDWCGWCKRMDKSTFANPVIVDYINKNYYAVKFNAEQHEDIKFRGHIYKFVRSGRRGYHEFAAALTQNQLSYPTYVFLDEDINLLQVIPGYRQAKEFEYILNFFGGDYYKTTPWAKFEKEFKPKL